MPAIRRRKIYPHQASNPQEYLSRYNRPAVISSIDTDNGICVLRWLDNPGGRVNVLLTQGNWGEYNMPIEGAIVLVQFDKNDQARIVRYVNLNQVQRQKALSEGGTGTLPKLKAGEKFWESVGGAYIYMNSTGKITLVSPFDDVFEIDPDIGAIRSKTVNWKVTSAAGIETFGQVRRWVQEGTQGINKVISDGVPTASFPDGTPLTEFNLAITDKYKTAIPICKIIAGTVVEDDGVVKNRDGVVVLASSNDALALKLEIQSSAGSLLVTIDRSGKFYVTAPRIVQISSDIRLGSESVTEKAVLGDTLKSTLENLIDAIKAITVTSTTPGTPTSPPINIASFIVIGNTLSDILSQKVKLE